jgi:ankyrin repeat protein
MEIVRWLIKIGKASVDQADNGGSTPLLVAAQEGHIEIIIWLIGEGKASIDQANKNGMTPLYIAAQNHHMKIVVWLIGEGKASVDQATKYGTTPLFIAAHMGQDKMVRWLIKEGNSSVDHVNERGDTPVFAPVQRCSVKVIRQANSEATPLSTAGYKCDVDMLRWLVEEGDANINTVSANGATPLLVALCEEVVNMDVVRFLLSMGARVGNLTHPVFTTCYVKASIQEEVRKLEVLTHFLHYRLSTLFPYSILHVLLFVREGSSHRARDARGSTRRAFRYREDRGGVHGVS